MPISHSDVYQKAFVVLDSGSETSANATYPLTLRDPSGSGAYTTELRVSGSTGLPSQMAAAETFVFGTSFSNMSVFHKADLSHGYEDLGKALSEMQELEEGDEWRIEPPVYAAACFVAAGLIAASLPAPRVFNHGPKSVVFNWSQGTDNLYLTVSADRMSALISSHQRIKQRIECSLTEPLNPALALSSFRAAYLGAPVKLMLSGSLATNTCE